MKLIRYLLTIMVVGCLTTATHAAVIDSFSDAGSLAAPLIQPSGNLTPGVADAGLSGVIGQSRSADLSFSGAAGFGQTSISGGQLYASTPSTGGSTLSLTYDGAGAGLPADLSGDDQVSVDFSALNLAGSPLPVTLTLEDSLAGSATLSQSLTVDGPQTLDLLLSGLVGSVDLTSVTSISLGFELQPNQSAVLNSISSSAIPAPEPGTLGICGLFGTFCLAARRRRRVASETHTRERGDHESC